jgi:hypothetical protein
LSSSNFVIITILMGKYVDRLLKIVIM